MDDQLLFEQFHAEFDIEPRGGSFERLRATLIEVQFRPRRRALLRLQLPRASARLLAAALLVALAVATAGAFIAINQYVHRTVPVRTHRVTASVTCGQGFHMLTDTTGWQGPTLHTTDGGVTWTNSSPPTITNEIKGGYGECTLDGSHAWMTAAVGTSQLHASQLLVLITTDGGKTWLKGGSVPASGHNVRAAIEFINDHDGWLLVDTGTRTIFATSDGGYNWTQLASGSTLDKFAQGCSESGMTFVSLDRGWLTWDCSIQYAPTAPSGSVAALTVDGGRTWAPVHLPSLPSGSDWICGAKPPLFTGQKGVMPLSCAGVGHNGWAGVYRTDDVGGSWAVGQMPFRFQLSQIDFVDANTGFAFVATSNQSLSDLYRTSDSGRDWALVKKNVFSGQIVERFQFTSASTGFAYPVTLQIMMHGTKLFRTTDGGRTWVQIQTVTS